MRYYDEACTFYSVRASDPKALGFIFKLILAFAPIQRGNTKSLNDCENFSDGEGGEGSSQVTTNGTALTFLSYDGYGCQGTGTYYSYELLVCTPYADEDDGPGFYVMFGL